MTTTPALTAARQPAIPGLDQLHCRDPRCRSRNLVLVERRREHPYVSPMPMPTSAEIPCVDCGQDRYDWPHWYRLPARFTHLVQCVDCDLILDAMVIGGEGS